jgi:hypothetical protein
MRVSPHFVNFNKQLLFAEIGAVVGTPLASSIAAHFTAHASAISLAAVLGGLVCGSGFWLMVKFRDEHRRGAATVRHLAGQIALFTPAASVVAFLVYHPTVFFMTRHLVAQGHPAALAALTGQMTAFGLFVVALNIYRIVLRRVAGKHI